MKIAYLFIVGLMLTQMALASTTSVKELTVSQACGGTLEDCGPSKK